MRSGVDEVGFATRAQALLSEQRGEWAQLRDGVAALDDVRTRTIPVDGFQVRVQFNPRRIASSAAKVDPKSIKQRKCFLCAENLPAEQRGLAFNGEYVLLANPFPIFPEHFTVPVKRHEPQRLRGSFGAFLELARALAPRYTVFYNGPKCGASAPDHLHFQAGDRGFMTVEAEYEKLKGHAIATTGGGGVRVFAPATLRPFVSFESADSAALAHAFEAFYRNFQNIAPQPDEPMMNVLAWWDADAWTVVVFPRAKHRPSVYYAQGEQQMLLSPGAVDIAGVCILPVERDFERLDRGILEQVFREVMMAPDAFARLREAISAVIR